MKNLSKSLTAIALLSTITVNVSANKIYSCKNSAGKMVYQDSPCAKSTQQLTSRNIDVKKNSGATINKAICRKSIENIHKHLMPTIVQELSAEKREELVLKGIEQCMNQHTEKDYLEILCFSRANSPSAAGRCVKTPKQ